MFVASSGEIVNVLVGTRNFFWIGRSGFTIAGSVWDTPTNTAPVTFSLPKFNAYYVEIAITPTGTA